MIKIITYGTFDLFHVGHLELLERLKAMGDYLIVGVSTDEFNQQKGKRSIFPFEQRAAIVGAIRHVDLVIPETCWNQKLEDIHAHGVHTFAIGEDWRGRFDFLQETCEVIYMPRTPDISSTEIKHSLHALSSIDRDELFRLFDILDRLRADLMG